MKPTNYSFHLRIIENPDQLTLQRAKAVVNMAQKLFLQVGVVLKLQTLTFLEMDTPVISNPFHAPGWYRAKFLESEGVLHGSVHLLAPPIYQGRYKFFGGAAGCICCPSSNVSVSSAFLSEQLMVKTLRNQLYTCAAIMAHEIGHTLGLEHDDSNANLMNSHMNMYSGHHFLKWPKGARKAINKCLAGAGK